MNKIKFLIVAFLVANIAFAQDKDDASRSSNLPENRLFWGGGIVASFGGISSNGGFTNGAGNSLILGVIPEIGYTIAKPLDIGLTFNLIYNSFTFNDGLGRVRQTAFNYGVGAFTRLHITDGFFLTAMAEQNFFNYRQKYADIPNSPVLTQKVTSLNALAGVGWGQRNVGEGGFYTTVLLDINKDVNSPYTIQGTAFPIFRVGYIKYFRKKKV